MSARGLDCGRGEKGQVGLGVAESGVEEVDDFRDGAAIDFQPRVSVVEMDFAGHGRKAKAEGLRPKGQCFYTKVAKSAKKDFPSGCSLRPWRPWCKVQDLGAIGMKAEGRKLKVAEQRAERERVEQRYRGRDAKRGNVAEAGIEECVQNALGMGGIRHCVPERLEMDYDPKHVAANVVNGGQVPTRVHLHDETETKSRG